MKRYAPVLGILLTFAIPLTVLSGDVIRGQKLQMFQVSPDRYTYRSVTLEDAFEGMDQDFTKIEQQNDYTGALYLKFRLANFPYACVGERSSALEDALGKCAKGHLVRVTGDLTILRGSRITEKIHGSYDAGPDWDESVYVAGPLPTEYIFTVGEVATGWDKDAPAEKLTSEGAHLKPAQYHKVSLEELQQHLKDLSERAIWFEGAYAGLDDNLGEKEKAAGVTLEKNLQFRVKGLDVPCLISKSPSNVEGFKEVAPGSVIHVFGRIRAKGAWAGFFADRVAKMVSRKAAPKAGKREETPPPTPPPPGI